MAHCCVASAGLVLACIGLAQAAFVDYSVEAAAVPSGTWRLGFALAAVWDPELQVVVLPEADTFAFISLGYVIWAWNPATTVATPIAGGNGIGFADGTAGAGCSSAGDCIAGQFNAGYGVTMLVHQTTGAFDGYLVTESNDAVRRAKRTPPYELTTIYGVSGLQACATPNPLIRQIFEPSGACYHKRSGMRTIR